MNIISLSNTKNIHKKDIKFIMSNKNHILNTLNIKKTTKLHFTRSIVSVIKRHVLDFCLKETQRVKHNFTELEYIMVSESKTTELNTRCDINIVGYHNVIESFLKDGDYLQNSKVIRTVRFLFLHKQLWSQNLATN